MSAIGSLFGSKTPPPSPVPVAPPPPTKVDASNAAKDEASKIRRGQGSGSTILTSAQGVLDPLDAGGKKTLGA